MSKKKEIATEANRADLHLQEMLEKWKKQRNHDIQSLDEKRRMYKEMDEQIDTLCRNKDVYRPTDSVWTEFTKLYLDISEEVLEIIRQNKNL